MHAIQAESDDGGVEGEVYGEGIDLPIHLFITTAQETEAMTNTK